MNWLVDGVSNVDVGSNITLLSTPTLESIEEFKIITNGYQAEWPRSGGGIVNVVTKSGSSRFAGSGYEFLRSDKLNANSFFRNLSTDPAHEQHAGAAQLQQLRRHRRRTGRARARCSSSSRRSCGASTARRPSLTANVADPAWLTDPANANYVAPALRDPNAVKLLALWPAPNVAGRAQFVNSRRPSTTRGRKSCASTTTSTRAGG